MATIDNVHVSELERLLKMGRDALFGVRDLAEAAGDHSQKLQMAAWALHVFST